MTRPRPSPSGWSREPWHFWVTLPGRAALAALVLAGYGVWRLLVGAWRVGAMALALGLEARRKERA